MSSETSTQTQVIIKDGETIVIGGLIQKKKTKIDSKVPFFSDANTQFIPITKRSHREKNRTISFNHTSHYKRWG